VGDQQHPKAVDCRYKSVPYYKYLAELFDGTYATGVHAASSDDSFEPDYDHETYESGAEVEALEASEPPVDPTALHPRDASTTSSSDNTTTKKRRRESNGLILAESVNDISSQMRRRMDMVSSKLSPSQIAIQILQSDY
jgi:hypothetical protein